MHLARLLAPVIAIASSSPADALPPLAFTCRVEGVERIRPPMSADAVCARFQAEIDAALEVRSTRLAAGVEPGGERRWVRIALRFGRLGTTTARVSHRLNGRTIDLPVISHSIMDRTIGPDTVGNLAKAVAEAVRDS